MTRTNPSDPVRPTGARLLSTAEVATILNVSRRSVLEWIGSGDLPAFRIGPQTRVIRVRESDLEAFIQRHIRVSPALPTHQAPADVSAD